MSYYVEQDDLNTVKQWFEENRKLRGKEAAKLEQMLTDAESELEEYERRLDGRNQSRGGNWYRTGNLVPNPNDLEIERYHRTLRERPKDIKRQLRDLVRWERDDLEWIRTLERQERELSKQIRSTDTRQQQRAANWRNKTQKGQPEPEEES